MKQQLITCVLAGLVILGSQVPTIVHAAASFGHAARAAGTSIGKPVSPTIEHELNSTRESVPKRPR